jgi:hypothetical protein
MVATPQKNLNSRFILCEPESMEEVYRVAKGWLTLTPVKSFFMTSTIM